MKKLLLLLLVFAGFMACENEIIPELPQEVSKTEDISAKEIQKIDVCHKGNIISISVNAWKAHEKHGDVMLIDEDGDGWVTLENECGVPVDCDDTTAIYNEVCTFDCICDMVSTIQNNPSNFCYWYNNFEFEGVYYTDVVVYDINYNYVGFVNINVDYLCGGTGWLLNFWEDPDSFTFLQEEDAIACSDLIISAIDYCDSEARRIKDFPKAYKEIRNIK